MSNFDIRSNQRIADSPQIVAAANRRRAAREQRTIERISTLLATMSVEAKGDLTPHVLPHSRWALFHGLFEDLADLAATHASGSEVHLAEEAAEELSSWLRTGVRPFWQLRFLYAFLLETAFVTVPINIAAVFTALDHGAALDLDLDPSDPADIAAFLLATDDFARAFAVGDGALARRAVETFGDYILNPQ